jgi:hypothetical protein
MKNEVKWHGMNWITQRKRIAIYLRDGLACVYCGASLESEQMSIDHIRPRSKGGSNSATNLVTACLKCNRCRGDRHIDLWLDIVAQYRNYDVTATELRKHIRNCTRRVLPTNEAKIVLANRIEAKQEQIENK